MVPACGRLTWGPSSSRGSPGHKAARPYRRLVRGSGSFRPLDSASEVVLLIQLLLCASAHHLDTHLAVRRLGHRPGFLSLSNPTWPSRVHQHRCHSGALGPSQADPGLPLWLQGSPSWPSRSREGLPGSEWLGGALRHDPGARYLSGLAAQRVQKAGVCSVVFSAIAVFSCCHCRAIFYA